eukprot:UN11089
MEDPQYRLEQGTGPGQCEVIRCPVPNQYPCGAEDPYPEGFVFRCKVPEDANLAGSDCTFSLIEQRDWGGCVDIAIARNVDGAPVVPLTDMLGAYAVTNAEILLETSFANNCCCIPTNGIFEVFSRGRHRRYSSYSEQFG